MNFEFGNLFTRLIWGGVRLLPLERAVLSLLVKSLPEQLREIVVTQLQACNLVQREVDGRALNFYRMVRGRASRAGVPDLPVKPGEVLLLKMAFRLPDDDRLLHATMTAIDRQFFCASFSQDLRPLGESTRIIVQGVTNSWRSGLMTRFTAWN
jgi:hypothetical protein